MAEIRSGIRHVLATPAVYDAFQHLVGAYAWRRRALNDHVISNLAEGASVLDIGCGTGDILASLPDHVRYTGFDRNSSYIEQAKSRYRDRTAAFFCEEFSGTLPPGQNGFDIALALGLLHHLEDHEVKSLMTAARNALQPGGFLVTLDPLLDADQSPIARFLVTKDRGRNVRTRDEYASLAASKFDSVEVFVDSKPLYIPYTGIVMRCRK